MQLRPEQLMAFDSIHSAVFDKRLIEHLRASFPRHCLFLGDEQLHATISYGKECSTKYGVATQAGVTLLIELTLLLGRHFDVDPQLPWAMGVLGNDAFGDPHLKVRQLHAEAIVYLDAVAGQSNEHLNAALQRAVNEPVHGPWGGESIEEDLVTRLKRVWPEKYELLGEDTVKQLIKIGVARTHIYRISTAPGIRVYVGLMYVLGSGFDGDPLFSWARESLAAADQQDQETRVRRLYAAAIEHFRRWYA